MEYSRSFIATNLPGLNNFRQFLSFTVFISSIINIITKSIPAPSFGALYTVKAQENPDKTDDIADLKTRCQYQSDGISVYTETSEDNCGHKYSTTCFVGDNYADDDKIETMLINKGIEFNRTSFGKLLDSPENIKERIILSPEDKARGFKLIEIDRIEFDAKYEFFSFGYIGNRMSSISQPEKTEKFKNYLKTGKKIHAPVIFINDKGNYPEIIFEDGRHRYAYMRDMRMNGIPVAMDEDSIKAAKKFGLLVK